MSETTKQTQLSHHQVDNTKQTFPMVLLLHDIVVAMNVGTAFRMSDALGVEKIYLTGETHRPPSRKITRIARSADKYVPYEYQDSPEPVIEHLKQQGYKIVGLEITDQSIDIRRFEHVADEKICLVLGSENEGISPELLALCDQVVHLPMVGAKSSMNVGLATSLAIYEFTRDKIK